MLHGTEAGHRHEALVSVVRNLLQFDTVESLAQAVLSEFAPRAGIAEQEALRVLRSFLPASNKKWP